MTKDSFFLNSAGREVQLPFTVIVTGEEGSFTVTAEKMLRVIPKKRLVCSGKWRDHRIVVKFFLKSRRLRRHFSREKQGAQALAASGVRTPEILFQGRVGPENVKVLAFREISQAEDMLSVWLDRSPDTDRAELQKKMVREIAKLHEAGLKQDDLHLGNFIISRGKIHTIDGDAVDTRGMGKPLCENKSLENLGVFFSQFDTEYDRLSEESFLFYEECRGWPRDTGRYCRLVKKIKKARALRLDRYIRKVFRDSTAFACHKGWTREWVCCRKAYAMGLDRFISDPDSFIRQGKILKNGNTATVARIEIEGTAYAVKRYNIKNVRHFFRRFLRNTRARISWRNAHLLTFLGIRTPGPVMFMEERFGPVRSRAFFVTEYISAPDVLSLVRADSCGRVDLAALCEKFSALFRKLADARVSHGDFKATNFILQDGEICLLDLDSMKRHRVQWFFRKAFRRDLARFQKNWKDLPAVSEVLGKAAADEMKIKNSKE